MNKMRRFSPVLFVVVFVSLPAASSFVVFFVVFFVVAAVSLHLPHLSGVVSLPSKILNDVEYPAVY